MCNVYVGVRGLLGGHKDLDMGYKVIKSSVQVQVPLPMYYLKTGEAKDKLYCHVTVTQLAVTVMSLSQCHSGCNCPRTCHLHHWNTSNLININYPNSTALTTIYAK